MKIGTICNANECIKGQFYEYKGVNPYGTLIKYSGVFYSVGDNTFHITTRDEEYNNEFRFFYSSDNIFKRVRKPMFITNPVVLKLIEDDKR